jgi:hypothetical protein
VIKLLSEADAQAICGGSFLDISLLNGAKFGNGNNVNLGYFPALTTQATTGGTAIAVTDSFNGNTITLPTLGAGSPRPSRPRRG